MNKPRYSGFTLVELLIVLAMVGILTPILTSVFLMPLRTHANLAALTNTTHSLSRAQQHLSEDVRCADDLTVETLPQGGQRLLIKTPSGTVRYETGSEGFLVRTFEGPVPLTFHFKHMHAEFTVDTTQKYKVLQAHLIAIHDMLKTSVEQGVERTYCSHLQTR